MTASESSLINNQADTGQATRQAPPPAPSEAAAAGLLNDYRRRIARYRGRIEKLPYDLRATCPKCLQPVEATFDWADPQKQQVALTYHCPDCGRSCELHQDTIWTTPSPDRTGSAETTYSGSTIAPNLRGLPRTVQTLCPDCAAIIVGRYFVRDDQVWIEKTCPDHGYVHDIINRDVRLYLKGASWSFDEQPGVENPGRRAELGCPADCGLCGRHQSSSCLANIDLTNRCNL
ncbi:MAG: hypothetical protein JW810_10205, partial [Sedimentisphaerales bacterium]|nr:hypothetical protein [Sedimentisphaerales bacterium]